MTPKQPNQNPRPKPKPKPKAKPKAKPKPKRAERAETSPTASTTVRRTRRQRAAFVARQKAIAATREAKELAVQARMDTPRCSGTTKEGIRCKSRVRYDKVTKRYHPDGLCFMHSKSEAERKLLMAQARAVRAKNQLKPHELMRVVIESNPIAFMQPYLESLGIRIVFVPDENDPTMLHPTAVVDPASKGATLFGVSKEGKVVVSDHKDIEAQQRAAERLFDRVYGKPKQTNIIAGASTQDEPQMVPFDKARQNEIAAILEAAKRPSHRLEPGSQN